uniref:Uncharacterized protein n=1 Tax=Mycena chlorophos TaxID=658473 RepID=A0ABQ0L1D0_MYCCL|nr:predicted protein [Mycena chlorophos]
MLWNCIRVAAEPVLSDAVLLARACPRLPHSPPALSRAAADSRRCEDHDLAQVCWLACLHRFAVAFLRARATCGSPTTRPTTTFTSTITNGVSNTIRRTSSFANVTKSFANGIAFPASPSVETHPHGQAHHQHHSLSEISPCSEPARPSVSRPPSPRLNLARYSSPYAPQADDEEEDDRSHCLLRSRGPSVTSFRQHQYGAQHQPSPQPSHPHHQQAAPADYALQRHRGACRGGLGAPQGTTARGCDWATGASRTSWWRTRRGEPEQQHVVDGLERECYSGGWERVWGWRMCCCYGARSLIGAANTLRSRR